MKCPSCSKEFTGAPACPRCGCDVSILTEIASAAGRMALAAYLRLRDRDYSRALELAGASWRLKHAAAPARAAFLACVALGKKTAAARWMAKSAQTDPSAAKKE